ncbi:HDOD domain-containing protein [Undibacterium sp. Jales W-56]|uniref:HDOD domain-containing protein n=1 Tax=Undibacterium sp. Jales W-56 TaxID=2897325 RepID=UPI0021D18538|nr:HDOD domain-containing protein [Undibacterium sp. Jales W-56]MCU6434276.1 HDOD domain-containing protein [Undibacterium sp. Jales W-56]
MQNFLSKLFNQVFSKTPPAQSPVAAPLQTPVIAPSPPQPSPPVSTITPVTAESKIPAEVAATAPPALQAWRPQIAIDPLFFYWLMGSPGEGSSMEIEQKILHALYGLLASDLNDAVVVPRVPTVIPQLLGSLRNKTVSAAELSSHIVKDVVLVGEVINAVNSALYNPADRINSLEKAVMVLGEDGLRLLIAKVAFRPIINLNAGNFTRRAAPHIWNQSEKCALACYQLATGLDPFQAFLTGLMKNVGLIIAFRLLDQQCEEARFKYSASFYHAFTSVAATLSYRVAQRWEFPATVVQALQQQAGGSKAPVWTPLGHLLHNADLLAKMRVLVNHAQLKSNDQRLCAGLSAEAIDCFTNLNHVQLYDTTAALQKNNATPGA